MHIFIGSANSAATVQGANNPNACIYEENKSESEPEKSTAAMSKELQTLDYGTSEDNYDTNRPTNSGKPCRVRITYHT